MEKEDLRFKEKRRDFIRKAGFGLATFLGFSTTASADVVRNTPKKRNLAMVIDLQKCTGCGACTIVCKNENNVQEGILWANKISKTVGKFPNVRYDYLPTLCNHCEKAPCVKVCPTQAMHKNNNNITMHDTEKCVGCRYCMVACPYKVISYNGENPHKRWRDNQALILGTASPKELNEKVKGNVIPYYNPERASTYAGIRPKNVVEKCTFCDHLVKNGQEPRCVERCPSKARIFGDLNDPESKIVRLLGKYTPFRIKESLGTGPKVFYIRNYNPGKYPRPKLT
jgi:molybdopterin-containing oxidoreductase family iron-sulfur binding subunit